MRPAEKVKSFFDSTQDGDKYTPKQIAELFPELSYEAIRGAMRYFETTGYLCKDQISHSRGNVSEYWRSYLDPWKQFVCKHKKTEPKNPRLWAF